MSGQGSSNLRISKGLRILCLTSTCLALNLLSAKASDSIASINVAPPLPISRQSEPTPKTVSVFYATSRKLSDDRALSYSKGRAPSVDYGVCQVRLHEAEEKSHQMPSLKSFSQAVKLRQSDILSRRRFETPSQLTEAIKGAEASSEAKGLIVFVHGYACSFEKAVRIGAKLSQGSGEPVMIFAWPSRNNFLAYSADECNAEWSYPDFSQTLQLLSKKFKSQSITLVSHSMGARIIIWTLREQGKSSEKFAHVFFSCPDIDKETFARYALSITQASNDTRVFVSDKDIRLGVSELLHGASRMGRPGNGKNDIPAMDGVQLVDFSAIDRGIGHCIPYPLIFQALNHEEFPDGIELIAKDGKLAREHKLEVVTIARKHEHKSIVQ